MEFNMKNRWTANADRILKYAKTQNDNGNVFPVWGTCMGFQLLGYLTGNYDPKILTSVRGQDGVINTLDFANRDKSYLYKDLTNDQLNKLSKGDGAVYFSHHWAITEATFNRISDLKNFWTIVSYTTSPYNEQFISSFESKKYPFYATQFHPEKNLYEWSVYADRTQTGNEIIQMLSNKFVEKARQSKNKFANDNEFFAMSIYKYDAKIVGTYFTQIYVFKENTSALNEQGNIRTEDFQSQNLMQKIISFIRKD